MALQIRRGTDTQRQGTVFAQGELVYTTDLMDLFVGDGVTQGGTRIAPVKSVNGLSGTVALTTDNVTQGNTNRYYSSTSAKTDVAAALTSGNSGNTGITFSYNSGTQVINAVVTGSTTVLSTDTNPTLGGNLGLNSRSITGTGTINITGNITGSGTVSAGTALTTTGTVTAGAITIGNNSLTSSTPSTPVNIDVGLFLQGANNNGYLKVSNSDPYTSNSDFENYNTGIYGGNISFTRGRGTSAAPTSLVTGDNIFNLNFLAGRSGGADISSALIAFVEGTVSSGSAPGRVELWTANSSGTLTSRLSVNSNGLTTMNYNLSTGASESLATGAAASLYIHTSYFTTSGASTATLAAGVEGLFKSFVAQDVSAGNMVITVTNAGWKASGTGTITFNARGQGCRLQYVNSKWYSVGNNGATFA